MRRQTVVWFIIVMAIMLLSVSTIAAPHNHLTGEEYSSIIFPTDMNQEVGQDILDILYQHYDEALVSVEETSHEIVFPDGENTLKPFVVYTFPTNHAMAAEINQKLGVPFPSGEEGLANPSDVFEQ